MPDAQDDDRITTDLEQDAVHVPTFAVKKLAEPFAVLSLGRLPAALRVIFKRSDGVKE